MIQANKQSILCVIGVILFSMITTATSAFAYSNDVLLRREMRNDNVMKLQQDLHTLGYLSVNPTGYFGSLTETAVKGFQQASQLTPDGIAGPKTISSLQHQINNPKKQNEATVTRSSRSRTSSVSHEPIQQIPWFGEVESIFNRGDQATVTDVTTGKTFQVQRTYGTNHADVETLAREDTEILKEIAGGSWNWVRRPVIVEVHGLRIAASMTAMPHAGRDDKPALKTVSHRSGGFGTGINLDEIKGNGMDGHIDIHFLGSKTHGSNQVDHDHQKAIREAYQSGL